MDIFKRKGFGGAPKVINIQERSYIDGDFRPAVAVLLAGFEAEVDGEPHLMPYAQVTKFFHEFGHIMHNLCTKSNYTRFSGANVEVDFVEMPSTMLEHWMQDFTIV